MRVLYLHQYFVTPEMGGGTRSFEMARRLVAAGHEVDLITTDQSPAPDAPAWRVTEVAGIRVHWTPVRYDNRMGRFRRLLAFATFAWRASLRAIRLRGDVIFATSTPLTIAIPAMIASAIRRRPFVFEIRDQWPDVPIAIGALRHPLAIWAARALERLTYRRARHIVALAPGMRDDVIAKGVPPEKVSVIPNGCDLDLFAGDGTGGAAIRAREAWLGDRSMVLFAGTFGEVNDVAYMVRLAAAVAPLAPEIRFVLIGAGRDVEKVRAEAARTGVLDRSLFLLPPVSKTELSEWLAASDVSVALFAGPRVVWKDAVQNKFFDALAAGRPVACNFDGWQTRVAIDADVGFLLDPLDVGSAAQVLRQRLADRAWLAGARQRARALGASTFDRSALADALRGVLERAAAER